MDINEKLKNRSDLKSYFVKNAIPTESNFTGVIDSLLNQRDDGIVKSGADPLSIEATGDDTSQKKAINFYLDFNDEKPSWVLSLNPRSDPTNPNTGRPGFSISDGDGNSRLCIESGTGRVGIGTTEPTQKLDVADTIVCQGLSLARTNTNRQPLFLAAAGDFNHALYNNYSNLDAEGSWDGAKWNTHAGLDIRIGTGQNKRSALKIAPNGNLLVSGELEVKGSVVRIVSMATGRSNDGTDVGQIKSRVLSFDKRHAGTAIRILYCDNLRVNGTNAAARWEIRVNGAAPPGGVIYQDKYGNTGNHHGPSSILAYAVGLPAGKHQIQIWVGTIPGYPNDAYTGWNDSTWTIEAEEIWTR